MNHEFMQTDRTKLAHTDHEGQTAWYSLSQVWNMRVLSINWCVVHSEMAARVYFD